MLTRYLLIFFLLFATPAWGYISLNDAPDYIQDIDGSGIDENGVISWHLFIRSSSTTDWQRILQFIDVAEGFQVVWRTNGNAGYIGMGISNADGTTGNWGNATNQRKQGSCGTNTWCCVQGTMTASDEGNRDLSVARINKVDLSDAGGIAYSQGTDVGEVWIGLRTDGNAGFSGDINEVAIWQAALTTTEFDLLCDSKIKGMPLQIQPSNLKVYFPLDDYGDGSALDTSVNGYRDISGNDKHGTGFDADGDSTNKAEEILSYP